MIVEFNGNEVVRHKIHTVIVGAKRFSSHSIVYPIQPHISLTKSRKFRQGNKRENETQSNKHFYTSSVFEGHCILAQYQRNIEKINVL